MAQQLNPKATAAALAIISGILSIACAVFFVITPQGTLAFFNNFMHGVDLTQIAQTSFNWGNAIIGLIEIVIVSWVIGWLFAKVYNSFI